MAVSIMRLPDVISCTGLSRSTIYAQISKGLLPRPVSLGARAVGWPADEVEAVSRARIAGHSDDAIEQLVTEMQRARQYADEMV